MNEKIQFYRMRRQQLIWKTGGRVMAVLLSLVLILSSAGVTAFAEEIPDANADLIIEEDAEQPQEVFIDDGQPDTPSEVVNEEMLIEEDRFTDESVGQETGDVTNATWDDLQSMINGAESAGTIRLTQSYTAQPGDSALSIPALKPLTIDLNGFTLNRGLADASAVQDGFVLDVPVGANLTLKDSQGGGAITGGNNSGDAGGIRNAGLLTMENVAVSGNRATGSGGGILSSGTLILRSGEITDNTAGNSTSVHGGGIYNSGTLTLQGGSIHGNSAGGQGGGVLNNGDMNVSGAPAVFSNSASAGNNIYLRGTHPTMTVIGMLVEGASLCVTKAGNSAGYVTSGYSTHNTAHPDAFFHADDPAFDVVLLGGEAYIGDAVKGIAYLSYAWRDGQLEESTNTTDSRWLAWPGGMDIPAGQYVVNRNITVNDRVLLQGDTSIILCDGCELNVKGLYIPEGSTLTIYGQSGGTGTLISEPNGGGAGIGGYSEHDNGSIVIHGGTVTATGDDHCAGIGSNDGKKTGSITIYGGTVTANGGSYGAGIGGGRDSDADLISIYGGTVTATGKNSSAGIGGGDPQGSTEFTEYIEIYGGTITATGDDKGAGIGGGEYSSATVKIFGGKVTATGGDEGGAGIGSGKDGGASHIDITGGEVEARTANSNAVGMGNCDSNKGTSIMTFGYPDEAEDDLRITSPSYGGNVVIENSFADSGLTTVFVPGTYTDSTAMACNTLVKYMARPVEYLDLEEKTSTENCFPVTLAATYWDDAWYAMTHDTIFDSEISVSGDVNLILKDGCTLTATNIKVPVGSSLTIWAQTNGTGKLIAQASDNNAGIGGAGCDCGTIIINGGIIYATGGTSGAGIGGSGPNAGGPKRSGTIIINRGDVTASSGDSGAGIGGGNAGDAGIITITGGTVTAHGLGGSAAIGSGNALGHNSDSNRGGNIRITGGTVYADCQVAGGTAIGGSFYNGGVVIDISGGCITATGGAMSIGTGLRGDACQVTLSWTDETKETMSVYAESWGSSSLVIKENTKSHVTLVKGFKNQADDTAFEVRTYDGYSVEVLNGKTLVPNPPVEYTVTFDPNNGEDVIVQTVESGKTVVKPADPTKDGFTFKGWYQVTSTNPETLADGAFDFDNTVITGNITMKAVWEEASEDTVIIKSSNVEFGGVIRLQFKFAFPADVLADEGAYLTFEKAGTTTTKLVSEGTASGEDVSFIIPVPAPEYADDITIKVYDGDNNQLTLRSAKGTDFTADGYVYSVRTYAQKMSQSGSTEEMRDLAKALDDYGTAAQIYFTYGDYSGLSVDGAVTAVTLDDLAPYALTTSGTKPAGVTGAGIMVEFESDNTLRITFKTDGSKPLSSYTFLLDGDETTPVKSGKNARLQVANIAAPNLDTAHTFAVSDGTDTYTITASALSYAYTSVKNGNEARQNLGKAMYLYNLAADTKFGS